MLCVGEVREKREKKKLIDIFVLFIVKTPEVDKSENKGTLYIQEKRIIVSGMELWGVGDVGRNKTGLMLSIIFRSPLFLGMRA